MIRRRESLVLYNPLIYGKGKPLRRFLDLHWFIQRLSSCTTFDNKGERSAIRQLQALEQRAFLLVIIV
jgi:hypothetical protein